MYYLTTAFSLSMLPPEMLAQNGHAMLSVDKIATEGRNLQGFGDYLREHDTVSFVGHQATATVLSQLLGMEVAFNRANLQVKYGDSIYVAQLGARPAEGQVFTREELEKISLQFFVITVMRS